MWLNNYEKLKFAKAASSATYISSNPWSIDMSVNPIRGTNGTFRDYIAMASDYLATALSIPSESVFSQTDYKFTNRNYCCNLVVGSGTSPVTDEDYCLESEITSLSCTAVTGTYNTENGTVTYEKVMKNTSTEPITVSEIGIVIDSAYSSVKHSNSYTTFPVLVYREILDAPITAEAGETFTVTITHQLPLPQS